LRPRLQKKGLMCRAISKHLAVDANERFKKALLQDDLKNITGD
jgi:hypothetical protein